MDVVRKGYSVIKRISLLMVAALLVSTLAIGAVAGPAFADCKKVKGQWTCTETVPGKNKNFSETTTTTTQGNLTNFSPTPQGTGTKEKCNRPGATEQCPPGQFPD